MTLQWRYRDKTHSWIFHILKINKMMPFCNLFYWTTLVLYFSGWFWFWNGS